MSKRRHPKFKSRSTMMIKKKKTRRGGKARHPMQTQDVKMVSKTQDEKKVYAHIKCFKCGNMDTLPLSVLTSLRIRLTQSMRGKAMVMRI